MAEHSTITIHPSLEAYRRAHGRGSSSITADPLEKFYRSFGLWFTGAIRDVEKPLPVLVEIGDEQSARQAARKGWRPLADGDPELVAMLRAHYAGAPEIPPQLVGYLAAPVAQAQTQPQRQFASAKAGS